MTKPTIEQQSRMVLMIQETSASYTQMLTMRRNKMLDIYKAYFEYRGQKSADWETTFWINKTWETVNKVTPRIISKDPKPIVTTRTDSYYFQNMLRNSPEKVSEINDQAIAIQDYLNTIFSKNNIYDKLKIWAKNMVTYGLAFAKTGYKYEQYGADVVGECPDIDVTQREDMLFDPRYRFLDDMPCIIEVKTKVRRSDIHRNENFFNIDVLDKIISARNAHGMNDNTYKNSVLALTGISPQNVQSGIDKDNLKLKIYYGYFNLDEEDPTKEKMYEITTVDNLLVIGFKEISCLPFEVIKAFDDTETFLSCGFVEKILSLEREMNFKKNSKAEYINHSLNRTWYWSPQSGVNPNDLISRPNGLIVATKGTEIAMREVVEVPHRQLPQDYFMESNETERDLQNSTFIVDTSNQKNTQALINTATGARIKFYESNVVLNEVRKNFEKGIEKISYKLLTQAFDNMNSNLIIKKGDGEGYWDINKEALRDAIQKYRIKIEANSSSFDSIENRRDDAMAKFNIGTQLLKLGVQVDMEALGKDVFGSFEATNPDKYIKPSNPMIGMMGQQGTPGQPLQQQPTKSEPAVELTQNVAQGNIGF